MHYTATYASPLGDILLAADDEGLTGLWFEGQKYYAAKLDPSNTRKETPAIEAARAWLDQYFAGAVPTVDVALHFIGTPFQNEIWQMLYEIPYGQTSTYGALAAELARRRGREHMSAQAVGGAVGKNEVSIIVPCHRVVGANGSLTGYAGGIDKKIELLRLEGALDEGFFVPKFSTAP